MVQAENVQKKRILVAPLDWGLGHATRCIPLIHKLLELNSTVILAADGPVEKLLKAEFPALECVHLNGYNVSYSGSRHMLSFAIAAQIPAILAAIKKEQEQLVQIVEQLHIDGIISDNRYGLHHPRIPAAFITHQLLVKTGLGMTIDEILQRWHYRFIQRFSQCWIPDALTAPGLSGELGHPRKLPSVPVQYIGPLSRMKPGAPGLKHLLVVLSGPEPQRTILEKLLLEQLKNLQQRPVVFVRGLPAGGKALQVADNITLHDHLPAERLNQLMLDASFIISRCGYSTVMDIAAIRKKSILIPTPGQTEQEYLARELMHQNFALCISQEKFRLPAALDLAENFDYQFPSMPASQLEATLSAFISKL